MIDNTSQLAYALLGCSILQIDRAYWAARLDNNEWICEARLHIDLYKGTERHFEWYEDLVCNGDCMRVRELWLLCPPNTLSPGGNTARLPIPEPGTAFNFKVASVSSNLVETWKTQEAHVIGRVDNKITGDCTCFIWDERYKMLCAPFQSNIHNFGTWRESLPPRGPLAYEKLGVKL